MKVCKWEGGKVVWVFFSGTLSLYFNAEELRIRGALKLCVYIFNAEERRLRGTLRLYFNAEELRIGVGSRIRVIRVIRSF